jgi:excisionase family DNA binding protein
MSRDFTPQTLTAGSSEAAAPDPARSFRSNGKTPCVLPRFALTRVEAAASLGVSVDFFEEHVQPDLRIVRVGRLRLVPPAELERWVERHAARAGE